MSRGTDGKFNMHWIVQPVHYGNENITLLLLYILRYPRKDSKSRLPCPIPELPLWTKTGLVHPPKTLCLYCRLENQPKSYKFVCHRKLFSRLNWKISNTPLFWQRRGLDLALIGIQRKDPECVSFLLLFAKGSGFADREEFWTVWKESLYERFHSHSCQMEVRRHSHCIPYFTRLSFEQPKVLFFLWVTLAVATHTCTKHQ